jgi:hypothetical protein
VLHLHIEIKEHQTMQNIQTLLDKRRACKDAREWASGKTWQTIYDTCERGTWLLWLLSRSAPAGLDKRTRVKLAADCANTVRHLMPDASKEALDVAIRYGNGEATDDELEVAAEAAEAATEAVWAARAAARAAKAAEAAWAVEAAWAAAAAAEAVPAACAAAEAVWAAWVEEAVDAKAAIDPQLANIVREIIPIEMFNIDPNSTYKN